MTLRPMTLDDADALAIIDANPAVRRYIDGGRPLSREDAEEAVRRELGSRWLAHLVEGELEDGELVGWLELRRTGPGDYELGYRLRQEYWGRGLATEGARVLVDLAFSSYGAERVWGQTMTANAASRAVMERCGLVYVRTFFEDWGEEIEGSSEGDVEYEITRERWQALVGRRSSNIGT